MQKEGVNRNMMYKVLETDDLLDIKEADRQIVDLMENNGAHLKLVYLKKHQEIEPHMSHADACIFVTEGEIEVKFNDEDNCTCQACGCQVPEDDKEEGRKYKIKKGQLFFFEKNVMHTLKALKDSNFLLIKI